MPWLSSYCRVQTAAIRNNPQRADISPRQYFLLIVAIAQSAMHLIFSAHIFCTNFGNYGDLIEVGGDWVNKNSLIMSIISIPIEVIQSEDLPPVI